MKIKILSASIFVLLFFLFSCNRNKSLLDKESLLNHYNSSEDSLKRKALSFLLENMSNQLSEIPDSTKSILSYKIMLDSAIVDNQFLLSDIDHAFLFWNKYPWADRVPFDVFLNYLLPYKIYREEPADWRTFFMQKYEDTIQVILNELKTADLYNSSNAIYYRIIVNDVSSWFTYSARPVMITKHPGLNELMAVKFGDCHEWSYLNVMILRSLGIPSSIDNIPLWGRRNGRHSTDVFWDDEKQKFRTAFEREITFPAKVFRYSYKIQNSWTDSIKPFLKDEPFLLDFLKHDHWIDVTHDHAQTATVDYPCETGSGFAYICVCNYGEWFPIYWGKIENNGTVYFKNMGTEMLYRVALPKGDTYEIISPIFLVDSTGNKTFFKPDCHKTMPLYLSKLNTGLRSWVEKGKNYSLYYSDEKSNWILFRTQQCEKDSLIVFEEVPSGTLYQLWDIEKKRRLERIFTYENGEQVFW